MDAFPENNTQGRRRIPCPCRQRSRHARESDFFLIRSCVVGSHFDFEVKKNLGLHDHRLFDRSCDSFKIHGNCVKISMMIISFTTVLHVSHYGIGIPTGSVGASIRPFGDVTGAASSNGSSVALQTVQNYVGEEQGTLSRRAAQRRLNSEFELSSLSACRRSPLVCCLAMVWSLDACWAADSDRTDLLFGSVSLWPLALDSPLVQKWVCCQSIFCFCVRALHRP
jgi:hypothetical protein